MNINNYCKSGLCDKLYDLFLLATYGELTKSPIYIKKSDFSTFLGKGKFHTSRFQDLMYENLKEYISFPSSIHFVNEFDPKNKIFKEYLGADCSLYKFYTNYVSSHKISLDLFLSTYNKILSQIHFNESKLINYINSNKSIGIHLRRSDKISTNPDIGQITSDELSILDEKTKETITFFVKEGFKHFYLCSDDQTVLNQFSEFVTSLDASITNSTNTTFVKTYEDLYNLSKCDYIVMSSKSSNFSLIASLLGNKKIIGFYMNNYLTKNGLDNSIIQYILFENLNINKIAIMSHQGIADYYNQLGLYNYIIKSYYNLTHIDLFVNTELNIPLVKELIYNPRVNVCVPKTNNTDVHQTCIICHSCSNRVLPNCPRVHTKKCTFVDETYYKSNDYKIINIGSFENANKWETFRKDKPFNIAFYSYANINPIHMYLNFTINPKYLTSISQKSEIIVHHDYARNLMTPFKHKDCYNLDKKSTILLDQIDKLQSAFSIFLIDSSYSVLIYHLQKRYNLFSNIPIFLYVYPGRIGSIYIDLPTNYILI